ncbi:site-2 protease family protein [Carboxylicivirga sp. A043]|uniref:site-2 protease family protein n=1 Tax=Carboxylicivirga litoralis TaxID=2816963 RepID=UPI0021CB80F7|nr:site-2 protease family protein [Carboxylicivirga sp. A043]MCU4158363.1 site-2 protease family protein [Carboxylicivirga sp. A043]
MDRKYQLEFCKICDNREFSRDKGIICKLTGDIAKFENDCPDFAGDRKQTPYVPQTDSSVDSEENYDFEKTVDGYPTKPIEETKKQSINRSLMSMGLFIAAFYLIFKWDITYILVLAGVIFIHEIGHFLAMRIFKYNDLGIFFVPLIGAFATGQKDTISQRQNVIILLAGPLPGVIIGVILYYFGLRDSSEFLIRTSNIFIFLNLFNLIPVMPLDGGRVIKSMFFENNELINKIFIFLSIAVLTIYSLYSQSYFLLVIPFFLLTQISNQSQVSKVKEGIDKKGIDINKSYEELTDEEYWLIRDEIGTHMKYFNRFITPKRYIIADNEQRIIKQVKAIVQKEPIKDLRVIGKILITLLWIMTFIVPFVMIVIYYIRLGIEIQ